MAKDSWRPGNGERLPTGWPLPGRVQNKMHSVLAKIPKRLLHPVWGIVVATALAFTGRSELLLRSFGLLAAILWLIVDLWVWLLKDHPRWHWRFVFGVGSSWVMLLIVVGVMYWWLDGRLQDQRDDVFQKLSANHYLQPGSEDDPMNTMFSVVNGGSYAISKKHRIICRTNLAVEYGGKNIANRGFMSIYENGGIMGGFDEAWLHQPTTSTLGPGSDAQTEPCLSWFKFGAGSECVDMTLMFWYSLETQPDFEQERYFRYVAYRGKNGQFAWYTEPFDSKISYCGRFVKFTPTN